jgi:hypothetical protein
MSEQRSSSRSCDCVCHLSATTWCEDYPAKPSRPQRPRCRSVSLLILRCWRLRFGPQPCQLRACVVGVTGPGGFGSVGSGEASDARVGTAEAGSTVGGAGVGSGGGVAASGAGAKRAPGATDASLGIMPCLGPMVTLSDTKQTLTVHYATDLTIVAWASHHSPRKYDVRAGNDGPPSLLTSLLTIRFALCDGCHFLRHWRVRGGRGQSLNGAEREKRSGLLPASRVLRPRWHPTPR